MLKNVKRRSAANVRPAMLLLSAILLSGCSMYDTAVEDDYVPVTHYDRYPIKVTKVPVKMGIAARAGMLTPEQINAATNFAQDARNNAQSKISIQYPSGGKSRRAATDIAKIFVDEGVPKGMIGVRSYPGGATSPIRISYVRKVAVTRECGDWSHDLSSDPYNEFHSNYGCATQHNIAAMVARPEDFERPRAMSPIEGANRTAAMSTYYLPAAPLAISSSSGP